MKKLSECEKHMPKETLLQKISCKFVANVLQLPENKKATFVHLSTNILWMEYKLNNFLTQPSGAPLHTLSKLFDVPVCFVTPPPLLQREADARYWMICLAFIMISLEITNLVEDVEDLPPVKFSWNSVQQLQRRSWTNVSANLRPGQTSLLSEWPQKRKLIRECWNLSSCQVSFVQRLQRSRKKVSANQRPGQPSWSSDQLEKHKTW